MSHRLALIVVAASLSSLAACSSSDSTEKKLYGATYQMQVTAFGKTDTTIASVDQGEAGMLVFDFTYGFYTDPGETNETGVQIAIKGSKLTVPMQPIHVDHSTGLIDGTVTGTGTLSGTNGSSITLTFNVLPSDYVPVDANGKPLPAGTTVDYMLTGTLEPTN